MENNHSEVQKNNKTYSFDFVTEHRYFYTQLTKRCVYDVLRDGQKKIDRKAIAK